MADEKYNIQIELEAKLEEAKNIINEMKNIEKASDVLAKNVKASNTIIQGAFLNIGTHISNLALKLPSLATATIKAFGEEEVALNKLSAAIRSQGGNVSEVLPLMRNLASEMQRITTYGDEQILAIQGIATSMGVSSKQMQTVIKSSIGLSSALGMDLTTATRAASAAIQGKTEVLTRYIPTLSFCQTNEEKLAKVQELSKNGFQQAQAEANGVIGKLVQCSNAWGDLQEVIGGAVAPTVKNIAELIKGLCEWFTKHEELTRILTLSLSSLAVGFTFQKVGGLLNVAKSMIAVGSATKGATAAMQGFNAAIKANPIGLIVGIATLAITSIDSLVESMGELSAEEKKGLDALDAETKAIKKAKEARQSAVALLDEYNKKISLQNETLKDVGNRATKLAEELQKLENAEKQSVGEENLHITQELIKKKEELAEVQKKYNEMLIASGEKEYNELVKQYATWRYNQEIKLSEARKNGIAINEEAEKSLIEGISIYEKGVELQRKYYADHAHLIKSEEDRNRIMEQAQKYAEGQINAIFAEDKAKRNLAESAKTYAEIQNSLKQREQNLELDILYARASGNESLAKTHERTLRISQLTSAIFENTRKEGMSRQELKNLQADAAKQAEDRYNLEKSVTDEIQRQNLAKNAQAKIEDILLTNKIEQLKAEGKLAEATALEEERDIRRTLAGLEGVSDKDKAKLAKTMRQTNDYRAKQDENRSRDVFGFSANNSRNNSTETGRTQSPKKPRLPATLADKNIGLYNEWKAAGGEKGTGKKWMDYRDNRQSNTAKRQNARTNAGNTYSNIVGQSNSMAELKVGGALLSASQSQPQTSQAKSPNTPNKPESPKPAISNALNNKLESMGVSSGKKKDESSKIDDNLKSIQDILKSIKSTISSTAEKK